ncbi:MAG: hypothetical protein JSS81_28805 [Acidobacteria bacterium]|nr:hypothetical protein [Acidobacteriota bacterium]
METLPDYLRKYGRILKNVFPGGLNEEDLEILIFLLSEDFSQRNLASLIAICFDRDYHRVLNLVYGAEDYESGKNPERLEEIRTALIVNGYDGDLYANY